MSWASVMKEMALKLMARASVMKEMALNLMAQNSIDSNKSILVQIDVMAWCPQAVTHGSITP